MNKNIITIKNTADNMSYEIQKALSQVSDDCENIIKFEYGKYRFERSGTYHSVFYPSNNESGEKDVVFPILNKKNLTIDGGGAEFIFCDRIFPFIIQNSENIHLKNFSIDFSFLRYCWGTVTAVTDNGFALDIDRSLFEYEADNGNLLFYAGSDVLTTKTKKLTSKGIYPNRPILYIFAGEGTDSSENLAAPAIFTDAENTKNGVFFKYREGSIKSGYEKGDVVFIGNDNNRENGLIFTEFSNNLQFSDISIYSGAGMGIMGQMCRNIMVNRLRIMPRPGRDDLFSITADALHFINCDGELTFKNSVIKKTMDDAVNVHGVYMIVRKVEEPNKVEVGFCHVEQLGLIPFFKGDEIHISDPETMHEVGTAVIIDVCYDHNREHLTLTFNKDISGLIREGSIIENPDRMPKLLIENCKIVDCPHMRISSSQKTIIRNNWLSLNDSDIYISDLFKYWYESGTVRDITISGNTFGDTAHKSNIVVCTTRNKDCNHKHGRIEVSNNTFKKSHVAAMNISFVEEFIDKNNTFLTP